MFEQNYFNPSMVRNDFSLLLNAQDLQIAGLPNFPDFVYEPRGTTTDLQRGCIDGSLPYCDPYPSNIIPLLVDSPYHQPGFMADKYWVRNFCSSRTPNC